MIESEFQPKEKVLALIDMDAFFASVEQRDNPELRGKPVLIAGTHPSKGVVTTCSYEARIYGCHSGMSVMEARKLCPHGIYIAGNHRKYVQISAQVLDICYRFTPIVESFSIDEMFLDVSGSIHLYGSKRALGEELRRAIKEVTDLPCSVGIAKNKVLAKLGSKLAKPNGLFIIDENNVDGIIDKLPVGSIFGIGKKTEERLNQLGIFTTRQLLNCPKEVLIAKFGKYGYQMTEILNHSSDVVVSMENTSPPKSISNETTLYHPTGNREYLKKVLLSLVNKVGFRLRKKHAEGKTIHIVLRLENFETHTVQKHLDKHIFYDHDIFLEVEKLFDLNYTQDFKVRLLGVGLSSLKFDKEVDQYKLFEENEKQKKIAESVDNLKLKFGEGIINIGDSRIKDYEYRKSDNPSLSFSMKGFVEEEWQKRKDLKKD